MVSHTRSNSFYGLEKGHSEFIKIYYNFLICFQHFILMRIEPKAFLKKREFLTKQILKSYSRHKIPGLAFFQIVSNYSTLNNRSYGEKYRLKIMDLDELSEFEIFFGRVKVLQAPIESSGAQYSAASKNCLCKFEGFFPHRRVQRCFHPSHTGSTVPYLPLH